MPADTGLRAAWGSCVRPIRPDGVPPAWARGRSRAARESKGEEKGQPDQTVRWRRQWRYLPSPARALRWIDPLRAACGTPIPSPCTYREPHQAGSSLIETAGIFCVRLRPKDRWGNRTRSARSVGPRMGRRRDPTGDGLFHVGEGRAAAGRLAEERVGRLRVRVPSPASPESTSNVRRNTRRAPPPR